MIICGVYDNALRERMLREPDNNLKKATELIGQAAEQTKLHAKQLSDDTDRSVHRVQALTRVRDSSPEEEKVKLKHKKCKTTAIKNCNFLLAHMRELPVQLIVSGVTNVTARITLLSVVRNKSMRLKIISRGIFNRIFVRSSYSVYYCLI